MGDVDYIVELCDELLGERAARDHTFAWLRDDAGDEAPVTAYYAGNGLAIQVLVESAELTALPDGLQHHLATLLAREIQPGLLVTGMFAHDETGALRRARDHDREVLARALETFRDEELSQEWNIKLGLLGERLRSLSGYSIVVGDDAWDEDFDDLEDLGEADEWGDDDEAEPDEERPMLGWRARPIAQAILGGAVLGRRAFAARYAGERDALELQILTALLLAQEDTPDLEDGEDIDALALALAAPAYEVKRCFHRLRKQGLAKEPHYPEEDETRGLITEAGREAVEAWLAHAAALFPNWPPDHPDAIGG